MEELAKASRDPFRRLTIHADGWLVIPSLEDWGVGTNPPVQMAEDLRELLTTLKKEFPRHSAGPGPGTGGGTAGGGGGPPGVGGGGAPPPPPPLPVPPTLMGSGTQFADRAEGALAGPWLQLHAPERGQCSWECYEVLSREYRGRSAQGFT